MIENEVEEANSNSSVFKNIPRKQKIAVFTLALGAIAIIVFWAWQFNVRLASSFTNPNEKKMAAVSPNTNSASSTLLDLSSIDTDHDTLSDYDEVNIYHTSPYLEDTDSDGITDGTEVKNTTDPNCPTGKVCNGNEDTVVTSTSTSNIANSTIAPTLSLPVDVASSSQQTLQDALAGKADAATLRQLLITSGADKAMLDQISDEDLMKSYQQTLQNQQ